MNARQLKKSILRLAAQGKLVPQDPADEPASALLERIRTEKKRLIKEGKIKKDNGESVIYRAPRDGDDADNLPYAFFERKADGTMREITEELPFEIPDSWEWTRIGSVFNLQAGSFVRANDIHAEPQNRYPCYGGNGLRGYVDNFNRDGAYQLIGRQGSLCGNINFADGQFYATEHAVVVDYFSDVDVQWIGYFLTALNLNQYSTAKSQPGLAVTTINAVYLPLPPFQEQRRIVACIDRLSPHIAAYDFAEQRLSAFNAVFPDALKKSILQAAVRGKLVPQDPADEPASVLMERIRTEKAALIKAGKAKKDNCESIIFRRDNSHYEIHNGVEVCIDEELPFEIPDTWIWTKLGSIGEFIRGNGIKRSDVKRTGIPCVRYVEIYTTYNISMTEAVSYVDKELAAHAKPVKHGDLLFTLTGEYKEEIGKTVAFLGHDETVIGGDLATFTNHQMNPLYLSYVMNAPCGIQQKALLGKGDNIVHISCEKLSVILVPLPPIAEQRKIVERIAEFLPIIEKSRANPTV